MRKDRVACRMGAAVPWPHVLSIRVGRICLLGCRKSLLRTSPYPEEAKIHSQPLASNPTTGSVMQLQGRKFWDVVALNCSPPIPSSGYGRGRFPARVLHLPSAQSMSTLLLGNRLHFRSCVPDFSKPFHRCSLWSFVLTVRTVQCQTYLKFVVRASRVSCRDAVPTKVAHAPQPLFVEPRAHSGRHSAVSVKSTSPTTEKWLRKLYLQHEQHPHEQ